MRTTLRRHPYVSPTPTTVRLRLPGFAGQLRVAQLTDLHVGLVTPEALVQEAVDLAVAAEPDIVALTGDFVAHTTGALPRLVRLLSQLPGPKIAVLGNHDHRAGAERVAAALSDAGVQVLDNTWTWLDDHGVAFAGVDDRTYAKSDAEKATAGLNGRPVIGLAHHPAGAAELWDRGVPLVLSGHTHGGQLHHHRFTPWLYERLEGTRHVSGLHGEEGRQVYVCPGIGAAVVPWRAGAGGARSVAILEVEGTEAA